MSNEFEQPVEPMSRTEDLLRTGTEEPVIAMSEIEKILRGEHIDRPHSRVADLLLKYNPSDILIEKSITENGTYYASADGADGYYKVVVDTPVIPPTVLEHLVETVSTNGTHTFTPGTGVDGFSDASITVNVPANVNEHGFPTNGVFNSSVYGLDGFNKAVVTMQTAAVRSATLNATQNGTYMPSSLTEEPILRTTIPDETETGVTANESLSNYDILRVTFTNKTTGVAGSRDIYPGNITYRSSNISFYERTIFVGDDADHYITLASSQATVYVLQKGYNITNMILIKKAGYFSEVDVNVPSEPDPGIYMYYWDLTKSLNDLILNAEATLSNSGAEFIEGTGIVISSTGYVKTKMQNANNLWGKTIEFHIKNMSKNFGDTCRLLTYTNDYTGGLIFRTDHWQICRGDTWVSYTQTSSNEILEDGVLKLVFDSDRDNVNIYINDTKIYEGAGWQSSASTSSRDLPSIGSVKNNNYKSYNMTVTSIRVYQNGTGGKGTTELNVTQNGTYTAPTGTAYSEVNVNVSQTPHLTSRELAVNGTFSSAVDNKDGYSSVTVNVQEAPVKTTSLSVTKNGTYVPGPYSELSLTIPTIPDEVETDVSAGYTITNFDNLRIEFTNKTTSATGHVDIYPSAIATQRIPMSFKNRTLIMGPDGDHYITIVNGYDSIIVLQKGYTITAMKLTSHPGYIDEVDVDVPTGPEIDYLYDWDFTKSLTDKIEGQTAVLLRDATRDSDGIHFYTKFCGCKLFDSIDLIGKTIEIDISSMDKKCTNGALITHSRDDVYGTMDTGCTSIYYSQNKRTWGAYGPKIVEPNVQTFQKYDDNIESDFFEGKTLKIVYVNDGSLLYVNNNFIGFQTNINLFNVNVGSWYTRHKLSLGGDGNNGSDCFYDAVITGCRIYNNTLIEKTITENGTYYAPDDNVDGYLKVDVNLPDGTNTEY